MDAVSAVPLTGGDFLVDVFRADGTNAGSATPNASGQYAVGSLSAGTYFVRVHLATGYAREVHDNLPCIANDCAVTSGTPVVLADGASATINFALAPEGRIAGTVSQTGVGALAGVSVSVYNASTSLVQTVTTDATGGYVVNGLAAGSYFVRAGELYNDKPCLGSCMISAGTPVAVTTGLTSSGIDFVLPRGGSISGTVLLQPGLTPLPDISVSAFLGSVVAGTQTTNASGQFMFASLAPGTYGVRPGVAANPATPVVLADGADISGLMLTMPATGGISGSVNMPCQISNYAGLVMIPPQVEVYTLAGTSVGVANGSGIVGSKPPSGCPTSTFSLSGLPAGQYYLAVRDFPSDPFNPFFQSTGDLVNELYTDIVCVAADCDVTRGTPVTVAAGAVTSGITIDMVLGRSIGVTGSATSGPGGVGVVPLEVFDARGVPIPLALRRNLFSSSEFVGLPPGTYFVKAGNKIYGGISCAGCPPTSGTPIIVSADSAGVSINIDVGPVRSLAGVVRDEGALPLSTIDVELYTEAGQLAQSVSTDLTGNYVFPMEAGGTYYLRTRNDRGFVDEAFGGIECAACDVRTGTAVTVAASDVAGIDFSLSPGGGIAGLVSEATGIPVPGTAVSVFKPTTGELLATSVSDAFGQFRMTVPAGSYVARSEPSARHGSEIFSERPCTSTSCDVTTGSAIAVTVGATTPNINFTPTVCTALTLSPTSLATAVVGRSYRQVLSVSGRTGSATYSLVDGVLPFGMTFGRMPSSADWGVIEGTPTVPGRYAFTVGVVDDAGCGTSRAYALDVQECAFTLSPTSVTVPAAGGTVTVTIGDSCGMQTVTATSFVTVQSNTAGQVVLSVPANAGIAARSDDLTIGRRVFTVRQGGLAGQPPFGALDIPPDGAPGSGSIALGGWALDDLEVARVQIFRDPVVGEPATQLFVGTAVFVAGARPDVASLYPSYPLNQRAGWGFLVLTNMLPNQGNGIFRLYAYAEDAEGFRTLLGARTVVANNATSTLPFGAIDTPGQGESIKGAAYLNWGWALTPQPKWIPSDGYAPTIKVLLDGVPVASPVYNLFRADVAGLFPGLKNSAGPVGYTVLDTTALAEGQHTIAWYVADDRGAAAGIGSRYFTVANSADAQGVVAAGSTSATALTVASDAVASSQAPTIAVLPGPDAGRRVESLDAVAPAAGSVLASRGDGVAYRLRERNGGARAVTLRSLERLQVTLSDGDERCAGTWAGYSVDGAKLGELPVGAAVDRVGTFYWQPGPGFIGTFNLLFVRTACDGSRERLPMTVTITAR